MLKIVEKNNTSEERQDPVADLRLEGSLFDNLKEILEGSGFFEKFAKKIEEENLLISLKNITQLPSISDAVKRNISENENDLQFYQDLLNKNVFQNFLIDQFIIFNNLTTLSLVENNLDKKITSFLNQAVFHFIDTLKAYFAYKDPLTNLWNNEGLKKILQNIINNFQKAEKANNQSKHLLLVFFIDVNNFKEVNESFGHDYGDEFLRAFGEAANRLTTRKNDIFARVGGDEFMFLMPIKQPKNQEEQENSTAAIAKKLEELKENFIKILAKGENLPFKLNYSIGVSKIADFSNSNILEDLLSQAKIKADISLGQKKLMKKNLEFPQPSSEEIGRVIQGK